MKTHANVDDVGHSLGLGSDINIDDASCLKEVSIKHRRVKQGNTYPNIHDIGESSVASETCHRQRVLALGCS